jgi:hypothetical protein
MSLHQTVSKIRYWQFRHMPLVFQSPKKQAEHTTIAGRYVK